MKTPGTNLPIAENVPLAPFTSLGIGGPARFLVRAQNEAHAVDALEFAHARGCGVFVLGGGSNLLVSDSGFPGLVIRIELQGIRHPGAEGGGMLSAAAGTDWDVLVEHAASRGLAGLECLSGIPGTVGGAPVQNIGAYGQEAGETIARIHALDRATRQPVLLGAADCRFGYRASIFNTTRKDRYVILGVDFELRPGGPPRVEYADLRERFSGRTRPPDLDEVRAAVLEIRRAKGMVVDDAGAGTRSAGSFFRNPVLDAEAADRVETQARAGGLLKASEILPRYPAGAGKEKLAAAWLIERAGFRKGYRMKNAGISQKHALALVNCGGATAQDVLDLMRSIQDGVGEIFGIRLEPEPEFVGFDKPE